MASSAQKDALGRVNRYRVHRGPAGPSLVLVESISFMICNRKSPCAYLQGAISSYGTAAAMSLIFSITSHEVVRLLSSGPFQWVFLGTTVPRGPQRETRKTRASRTLRLSAGGSRLHPQGPETLLIRAVEYNLASGNG